MDHGSGRAGPRQFCSSALLTSLEDGGPVQLLSASFLYIFHSPPWKYDLYY
jgi:hypothetical protein